jgi:predicted alpha/beta superfamily hydrolase
LIRTAILLCLLFFTSLAVAEQTPDSLVLARKFTLHSNILQEDRAYWVYLPASYELKGAVEHKYPVLYLLDGRAHLNVLTGIVHHLSSYGSAVQRIPEMIVVALVNTKRSRDFTPTHMTSGPYSENSGGSVAFLRFIKEELIPQIESRYRALPERTLVGHSLGGLLALNAYVEQPELFRTYIAIDPSLWWDDQVLIKRLRQQPARTFSASVSVFVAMASNVENKEPHETAIQRFRSILETRKSASLRVQYQYFEDETHLSVPLIAIYRGLLFAYDGYQRPASTSRHAQ